MKSHHNGVILTPTNISWLADRVNDNTVEHLKLLATQNKHSDRFVTTNEV